MRKVLIIGMNSDLGGIESYIINLVRNLDREKYEFWFPYVPSIAYEKELRELGGLFLYDLPLSRRRLLNYYSSWIKALNSHDFDVVYFNNTDIVNIDILRIAKFCGVPVRIFHAHNSANPFELTHRLSVFHQLSEAHNRRVVDQYANLLFACSDNAGAWMFDGRKFQVIKNGIGLSDYSFSKDKRVRLRRRFGYGDGIIVGMVGRLSPQKNPQFALKVFKRIYQDDCKATMVFVGDGELRSTMETVVKEAGLEDHVRFTGAVNNVSEWLSAMDVLIMPSLFEGLPFALVEAQAAGLPCVVSSSVSKEADLTGLVTYVSLEESPSVWAETIRKSIVETREDTTTRMIDAGYSIENTAREVTELIEKALEQA